MADPHLPQSRRPLLDYITVPGRRYNTPEGFNVWLLPWLNTKILMNDPMMFLRLLWTRTNYSPEQWTLYDNLQLRHAWETGVLQTDFCLQCIVVHGSRYGDLVEMEEDAIHRGDVIGFPRAQLVFEAQERLLSLLRRVVEQLLQGTGTKILGSFEKWPQLSVKDSGMSKTLDFCSPDVHQPFLAPPELNIDHLLSVAQTRLKEAEDHIWLLQTDPYYMQHSLNISRSGALDKLAKSTSAACVPLSIYITEDIMAFVRWQWVTETCEEVKRLHQNFQDDIQPGHPLPKKYDRALGDLELMLNNHIESRRRPLLTYIAQRPGFEHHFTIDPILLIGGPRSKDPLEDYINDPLYFYTMEMMAPLHKRENFDHAMIFASFDRNFLKGSQKERARIDESIYQKLSDLAALHEMLRYVRYHKPRCSTRSLDDIQREGKEVWKYMIAWIPGERLRGIDAIPNRIGMSLERFYSLPLPTGKLRWRRKGLEQLDDARTALASFWHSVRKYYRSMFEGSEFAGLGFSGNSPIDLNILRADRSPELLAAIEDERRSILDKTERKATTTQLEAESSNQAQWDTTEAPKPSASEPKIKVKTRPTEQDITTKLEQLNLVQEEEKIPEPKIPISRPSLKIIEMMFPAPSPHPTTSVDWKDFVALMADAGFSARSAGGSAVIFEQERHRLQGQASKIVFHKPHPDGEVISHKLRWHGRRLAKWFGWNRDTFCLEERSN